MIQDKAGAWTGDCCGYRENCHYKRTISNPKCIYRRAARCMKQILMTQKERNSEGPARLSTTDRTARKLAIFLSGTLGDIGRLEGSPTYSLYSPDTAGKLHDTSFY